jgi:hypothetical protein
MVQIAPPADWSDEAVPVASCAVVSVAGMPEPDFAHVSPPSEAAADMFEAAAAAAQAPPEPASVAPVAVEIAAVAAPSAVSGSSLVLCSVAAAAVILVGGLSYAFWPDDEATNVRPPTIVAAAVSAVPATDKPSADLPPANIHGTDSSAEPYTVAKPAAGTGAVALDDPIALPELPADDVAAANAASDAGSKDIDVSQTSVADAAPAAAPSTTASDSRGGPVLKFDPLDFDPSNLSLGSSLSSTTTPPTSSVADDPAGGAASSAGATDEVEQDEEGLIAAPAANATITVRIGPVTAAAPRADPATQLAFDVEALEVADMPLVRFVETLSEVSGLPITLDPVALELAGSSWRKEVTLATRDTTLEKILRSSLSLHRLDYAVRNGHLVVSLAGADRRSAREFDFNDLMNGDAADAAGIVQLIQTFVSPQSWKAAGGAATIEFKGGKLHVEQMKAVHHEMLLFCERLRLARGMPLKSSYPAELLSIDSPYSKLDAKLAERTTFTFLPWSRLADVLRHWQDTSGLTILADWRRMADLELGASTPVACSAVDRSWAETLDEILEPLGLGWWAVDGTTIQITSREAIDAIHRVEFYEIPKPVRDQFTSGAALLETLRAELREEVSGAAAADQLQMHLDKPSRRLIVRGTPLVQRFLSERLRAAGE